MIHLFIRQMNWIWGLTDGYRWKIMGSMGLDVLALLFGLLFIYESRRAVDMAAHTLSGSLELSLCLIAGSLLLGILVSQLSSWISERVKIQMTVSLQNSLVAIQMHTIWTHTKKWHTGDLMTRLHADVLEVVQMVVVTFPSVCVTGVRMVASWGLLWMMDSVLAWMILAISPLFLFSKIYYRKMKRLNREVKEMESQLGIVLQENLKQRLLVRALRMWRIRYEKYESVQRLIEMRKKKLLHFSAYTQFALKCTFNGGYLLAFMWGIFRLHAGMITFGTLTAFLQLVSRVQAPVLNIVSFVPAFIRCRTSLERLMELYEEEYEANEPSRRIPFLRSVEFWDVTFSYEDRKVIKGLTAEMCAGVPTAVVGTTGKGKTTLIRLMLALVCPEDGGLFLRADSGCVPVSVATRVNFSYVPQGNTLFCGTLRENLTVVQPPPTEEQIREALEVACAEFVYTLPSGIDTMVGEAGYGLSEGQAQRIAIARALLCEGDVWLFDESTSSLDRDTSDRLIRNLMRVGREKIIIFVTHDSRLIESCPQVIRLDK